MFFGCGGRAGGSVAVSRPAWGMRSASGLRGRSRDNLRDGLRVTRGLRLNMANNPKKVKDPTEVALSAIQEALNISDGAAADSARSSGHSDAAPANASSTSTPAYNESAFDTRPSEDRQIFEPIEEPRPTRRAANDDRETIGQILQAIQKGRPAR